ncbi:DHHC-type zinc finger domain-containing protein [Encephalitozoon intestinalis ATCC 50506]|uniref:Palmitoyltransferase n=1 Tax=Encephalitozoon intestinalis (strain ATCC 50506) TaxID=876142 RepID=E0S8E2_ENCIT|nr:DHHC-type zinc finger domain-containing protein [Encephalitozoon intestinalis ATCC 50506]ADM12079.1 DHHC-type zinc finger domain-containing protein [Encephalitozoon intestinalis ATCC 50506]UTX45871.1 palmitoyltransferase [Encephalitozoon intestinalis]
MEAWKMINKLVAYIELLIVTFVILLYLLGLYEAAIVSGVSFRIYLLLTSFYYYVGCLAKSPGQLLDFGNANVKGICNRCNRIVGTKTVHCEICNKCYHKRDHHCPIIGRCVASNNLKDLYLAVFFMSLHSLAAVLRGSTKFAYMMSIHKYLLAMSSAFTCWLTLLILTGKTTKELTRAKGNITSEMKISRLKDMFRNGLMDTLVPYLKWKTHIVR